MESLITLLAVITRESQPNSAAFWTRGRTGRPADSARRPRRRELDVEVPSSSVGAYHLYDIEMQAFEDQGELFHQSDVEIPLNVLDDFRRFRCLDVLDGHHAFLVIFIELCAILVH